MTVLHSPAPEATGLARLLDPIELNRAVRRAFSGMDAGPSLMIFFLATLFSLATGAIWWRYDLMSTWDFTQGIQADISGQAGAIAERAAALAADPGLVAIVGGLIAVAITLLPSLAELIAPRVLHAGVQLLLNASVLFDLVTDWGAAHTLQQRMLPNVWGGIVGDAAATFAIALVISVGVQVLFILGITTLLVCALNILGLGRRRAEGLMGGVTYVDGR